MSFSANDSTPNPKLSNDVHADNTDMRGQGTQQDSGDSVNNINSFINTGGSIGFGTSQNLKVMSFSKCSEQIATIVKNIKKAYEDNGINDLVKPNIDILDNVTDPILPYSGLVISAIFGNKGYYFTFLLEISGTKSSDAEEIAKTADAIAKNAFNNNRSLFAKIFTPQDANDKNLHDFIKAKLNTKYGKDIVFTSIQGAMAYDHNQDYDELAYNIACMAINNIVTEHKLYDTNLSDISLSQAIKADNGKLEFKVDYSTNVKEDIVKNPIRQDWTIRLESVKNINPDYNGGLAKRITSTVTNVSGFVDAIPDTIDVQSPDGFRTIKKTVLRPCLIATSLDLQESTPSNLLLSIMSLSVMANPGMWLQSLNTSDPDTNVGNLNIYCNVTKEPLEIGQLPGRLNFASNELDYNTINTLLLDMFSIHNPVICVDVQGFGPESYTTSLLYAAASGTSESAAAAKDLIAAAVHLTDGFFPANFPIENIFATQATILPAGYFAGKHDIKDIRSIDLATVCSTNDVSLANAFAKTNISGKITGIDPFLERVKIISKIAPRAKITGKVARVMFSSEFLNTLNAAAQKAGLVTWYDVSMSINNDNNLSVLSNPLNKAGFNGNNVGFAQQNTVGGFGFQTNFNTGFFR